jgi:hypothetical protein
MIDLIQHKVSPFHHRQRRMVPALPKSNPTKYETISAKTCFTYPIKNSLFLISVYLRSSAFQIRHSESASKS